MARNENCKSIYIPDDLLDWWYNTTDKGAIITDYLRTINNTPFKQPVTKRERVTPPVPPQTAEERSPQKAPRKSHPSLLTAWDYYIDKTGSTRTLTEQRKNKLNARLNELGPEILKKAIDYLLDSPFHNGDNDRKWKWDIDFLIRNQEQVEKFAELYTEKPKKKSLEEMFNEQS